MFFAFVSSSMYPAVPLIMSEDRLATAFGMYAYLLKKIILKYLNSFYIIFILNLSLQSAQDFGCAGKMYSLKKQKFYVFF